MSRAGMLTAGAAVLLGLSTLAARPARFVVWNLTPSIPTGLYWITAPGRLQVGDRVMIDPPPALRRSAAARGYLAPGVRLLKRVAAVAGQQVCRTDDLVTIDGRAVARALAHDRAGRAMPVWSGCRILTDGQLFVMSPAQPSSFDGRYFGPIGARTVTGRAVPVWTDERGDGAHIWFAHLRHQHFQR